MLVILKNIQLCREVKIKTTVIDRFVRFKYCIIGFTEPVGRNIVIGAALLLACIGTQQALGMCVHPLGPRNYAG